MIVRKISIAAAFLFCAAIYSSAGCTPVVPLGSDVTAPTVLSTNPASAATGGTINQVVKARFSEFMASSTVSATSFTVTGPAGTPVVGVVSYDGSTRIATFAPSSNLPPATLFTATITTGAKDTAGNQLAVNYTWTFTTGATVGQSAVNLATASEFSILAGNSVDSSGSTSVTGDIGVYPGLGLVGFPPGVFVGAPHTSDLTAQQAQVDLSAAFNDAASRIGALPVAGDLGGLTLAPGLYQSTTTLEITSGDLILDSTGDADAVYIFQIGSTFSVANGRRVFLNGGVKASNVFWQVGSTAYIGTNSIFKGNVMADQTIRLNTGATLDGRALSKNDSVQLNSNNVAKPAP